MAREQRRLAAIMAVDVVGYSRLMGRDESGTLARLKATRAQHFEPALARHGGRLAKLTGDGALAEFGSAAGALAAAIEFQEAMAEASRIGAPQATAEGFLHLSRLALEWLILVEMRITDDGARHLAGMKSLQSLYLPGCEISDAARAELERAIPHVHD